MGHIASNAPYAITVPRSRNAPPHFTTGLVIGGRYRLIRFIARGGMAEVWLAHHESLKRDVAIKFIDQRLVLHDDSAIQRFRLEAQISARIGDRTRNVVAVHDAGEHEGHPFLVMEYVPGRTLADEIEAKGVFAPEPLADLLDQAADALTAAHEFGIIHRDLKPSNLMLIDEPGGTTRLKIADFGIAKALRDDLPVDRPKETGLGELVGSPAYMSPEQIHGERDLDGRTDLWSLGVVMYEALAGENCFSQRTMTDLVLAITTRRYKSISEVRPDLPPALDAWFARALALKTKDRFSTADEMAQEFRTAIAPPQRNAYTLVIAGAALLLASAVLLFLSLRSRGQEPADATSTANTAAPLLTAAPPSLTEIANDAASARRVDALPDGTAESLRSPSVPAGKPLPPGLRGKPNGTPSSSAPAAPTGSSQPTPEAQPTPPPPPPVPTRKRIDPSEIQ